MTRVRRASRALARAALLGAVDPAGLANGDEVFAVGGKPDDPSWSRNRARG